MTHVVNDEERRSYPLLHRQIRKYVVKNHPRRIDNSSFWRWRGSHDRVQNAWAQIVAIVFTSLRLVWRAGAKRALRKTVNVQQQVGVQKARVQRKVRRRSSAVSCAVEADRGSASDARGEDSALRGSGSDAPGGEDGGPRGASSAKSASWLRSAWLSSRVKAGEDSTWMRSSPSPSSSTTGGAGESFELYAGEYSTTQRPTIYHKNCCGAVPGATCPIDLELTT
ncbi:hypothetical protein PI124_g8316 [Phytophthora idaei]|nr:hypothetical protein PI125_g8201 [Phytophthora idaei]KAG3159162.1 hypothetical protein PI126_g7544 [Phytophthora idaei]KAG3246975.1 hypothetical protein PI124_g8316 [Phytophthora idaei]